MITRTKYVEEYLAAFKAGKTMLDLAKALGMTYNAAYCRMVHLKKAGVKLPVLNGVHAKPHSVDLLNKMIDESLQELQ